jgi:hypothetical protein
VFKLDLNGSNQIMPFLLGMNGYAGGRDLRPMNTEEAMILERLEDLVEEAE